jgi:hypothetical protein
MARVVLLKTRSFGSEARTPGQGELAGWVAGRRGREGDLVSYLLEDSLRPQLDAGITIPCAGGDFYRFRVTWAGGIHPEGLTEPELGEVISDVEAIRMIAKGVWFSIPSFSLTGPAFRTEEDEQPDEYYGRIRYVLRAMRDAGAGGHVIRCNGTDLEEIEALSGGRRILVPVRLTNESLENILEYQPMLPLDEGTLQELPGFLDRFRITRVILTSPDSAMIGETLLHLDPELVEIGGYCPGNCPDFWKKISNSAQIIP